MGVFDDTFVPPGLGNVWFSGHGCPECVDHPLDHVRALDESHWLCASCGQCWHVEHGLLRSVDPLTCHGCATRRKSECIALWADKLPRYAAETSTDDTA